VDTKRYTHDILIAYYMTATYTKQCFWNSTKSTKNDS